MDFCKARSCLSVSFRSRVGFQPGRTRLRAFGDVGSGDGASLGEAGGVAFAMGYVAAVEGMVSALMSVCCL